MQRKSRRRRDGGGYLYPGRGGRGQAGRQCRQGKHARHGQALDAGLVVVMEGMLDAMPGKGDLRQDQRGAKQQQAFHEACRAHCAQVPRRS